MKTFHDFCKIKNENLGRSMVKHGATIVTGNTPEEMAGGLKVFGNPTEAMPRGGVVYRAQRINQFKIINAWLQSNPSPEQLKDVADLIQHKQGGEQLPSKPWFSQDPVRKTW